MNRRHDIDALRALAFALLILYHLAMVYIRDWGFHVKSSYTTQDIEIPMLIVNRWRMDLIFVISGVATAFMMRSRPAGAFLRQRAWRLLLPLAFGMAVVVPIQPYAEGVMKGVVPPGFAQFLGRYYTLYLTWNHLWYLAYLFPYTVVLVALKPLLARFNPFAFLRGWRLLVYPAVPVLACNVALLQRFPETHDLVHDWYLHAVYFTMFVTGWWMGNAEPIWVELARLRRYTLAWALAIVVFYLAIILSISGNPPFALYPLAWVLRSLYVWLALSAILGWGHAYLNRPFKWLPFATEAVYPWYVLHQSLIIALAYWLIPLRVGPVLEPLAILVGTIAGCWALHVLVIRRWNWLRACFGMAPRASEPLANERQRSELAVDCVVEGRGRVS